MEKRNTKKEALPLPSPFPSPSPSPLDEDGKGAPLVFMRAAVARVLGGQGGDNDKVLIKEQQLKLQIRPELAAGGGGASPTKKAPLFATNIIGHGMIEPTRKRYLILLLFVILSMAKSFQWICLGSMTNIVAYYYDVDNLAINWTCIIFMATYILLALPVTWLMDNIGLRQSILIGSIGTTLGVIIKCFSCYPGGFYISMLGHLLVGFSEPFFFSLYSKLASVWFPDNQVSLATSVSMIGEQFGIALGFIIPGMLIGYDIYDDEAIQRGLLQMFLGLSAILIANTILVYIYFDDQPKKAPGIARFKQIQLELSEIKTTGVWEEIIAQMRLVREFMGNKDFLLLFIGFGINVGANISMHTILNQMIAGSDPSRAPWDDATAVVGRAGLILIVVGFFGSLACGFALDTFHKYKLTTIMTYLFTLLAMALVTVSLQLPSPLGLYLAVLPLGFFISGYGCCGFEYAVEITYPKPELVSSTLLNISAQIFGIPISLAGSAIVDAYGNQAVGLAFCAIFLVGLVLTCFQNGQLKRQNAVCNKEIPLAKS